ncbi:hypothetical protein HDU93_006083 [Gonapodya sp. JEL0774]|nr:hypothetical protein HDU93_006083 [Gonapodya sp. JEL0774]
MATSAENVNIIIPGNLHDPRPLRLKPHTQGVPTLANRLLRLNATLAKESAVFSAIMDTAMRYPLLFNEYKSTLVRDLRLGGDDDHLLALLRHRIRQVPDPDFHEILFNALDYRFDNGVLTTASIEMAILKRDIVLGTIQYIMTPRIALSFNWETVDPIAKAGFGIVFGVQEKQTGIPRVFKFAHKSRKRSGHSPTHPLTHFDEESYCQFHHSMQLKHGATKPDIFKASSLSGGKPIHPLAEPLMLHKLHECRCVPEILGYYLVRFPHTYNIFDPSFCDLIIMEDVSERSRPKGGVESPANSRSTGGQPRVLRLETLIANAAHLTVVEARKWIKRIPLAIQEIHGTRMAGVGKGKRAARPQIAHGEPSETNVLIVDDEIVLVDFGFSFYLDSPYPAGKIRPRPAPNCQTPPQFLRAEIAERETATSVDIWAVGSAMFKLLAPKQKNILEALFREAWENGERQWSGQ